MKNKNFIDRFKIFYNEKNGKIILFFSFYLIFFIFLGFYLKSDNKENKVDDKKEEIIEEKIETYDITKLINNNFKYEIEINDNGEIVKFTGTKNNIDYANYEYKYFLDIYNLNQLLKRSKFINSENFILTYELSNKEINELLVTDIKDDINRIMVLVNNDKTIKKITLDLSNYFQKEKYEIVINYTIGENDENSLS